MIGNIGRIIRIDKGDKGNFGVLTLGNKIICVTMERPWKDNRRSISCIPPNFYIANRVDSPKFGDTFEIMNVPGRSNILFHKGNTLNDSTGCVLIGGSYGEIEEERAILSSSRAFIRFMEHLKGVDSFPLQIINLS